MASKTIALVLFGLPVLALAQPEPTLPENPTSPTDFQAAGTLPQRVAEAAPAERAASPSGYSGGDLIIGDTPGAMLGETTAARREPVPEFHVVKEGETLWSLCERYYGDPWTWPQLWARNRRITNPHWIYPGDRIRMIGGEGGGGAARGGPQSDVSVIRFGQARQIPRGTISLRQTAFIDPAELGKAGKVVGSKKESLMLSNLDEIYVGGDDGFRPQRGQSYTIYKVRRTLRDDDKTYGHIVEVLGEARVKDVNDRGVATATITNAINPVERGHFVGPLRRAYKEVAVRPANVDLDAHLVARFQARRKLIGTNELVFIDRGRRQGVQLGNRFLVLRRGDGYRQVMVDKPKDNPDFPQEVVAEIAVLDLRDDSAVGLVTRARKELHVGEKLHLRRGY